MQKYKVVRFLLASMQNSSEYPDDLSVLSHALCCFFPTTFLEIAVYRFISYFTLLYREYFSSQKTNKSDLCCKMRDYKCKGSKVAFRFDVLSKKHFAFIDDSINYSSFRMVFVGRGVYSFSVCFVFEQFLQTFAWTVFSSSFF